MAARSYLLIALLIASCCIHGAISMEVPKNQFKLAWARGEPGGDGKDKQKVGALAAPAGGGPGAISSLS